MRYKILHIFIVILMAFISFSLGAQSREGARKQMNQGNYSNALKLLDALEEIYPGQFTNDLRIARNCLNLQRTARAKYKSQYYTEAESLYNQILKLNPQDEDARQAITRCQQERNAYWASEYARCKTIADYRTFVQRFPTSPQAKSAQEKINEFEFSQQDNNAWIAAINSSTIDSYTRYLIQSNKHSKHIGEAFRNRARLYYKDAANAQSVSYRNSCYSKAKQDYTYASNVGTYLSYDDKNQYKVCQAEDKFRELGKSPLYYSVKAYIEWANEFRSNSFVAPHLHLDTAYAMLVDAYCRGGMFDTARTTVEQYYGQMSSSFFTSNSEKQWSKSEWKSEIRRREKAYKKKQKEKSSSQSSRFGNATYRSRGTNRVQYPFQISIPIVLDYTKPVRSIGGGIGVGGYGSPFHVDVIGMYTAMPNGSSSGKGAFLIKLEPVFNFKRYNSEYPFRDFHINAGPTIGYSTLYGFTYGAKVGIGIHYSDLAFTASYSQPIGWYFGCSFRFHIAHFTIR